MFKLLRRFSKDEAGATAIEYGLIASLVVIAIITSMSTVANESSGMWETISERSREAADKAQN